MKFLVAFSCLLAAAAASPGLIAPLAYNTVVSPVRGFSYSSVTPHLSYTPLAYSAPVIAPAPIAAPVVAKVAAPVVTRIAAPIASPVVYSAPAVAAAPVLAQKTQYHAQDELGQASYGHSEAFQNHNAVQDAHGNKVGSYNYVAPDGQVISASYVADALGFRVASNALPVGPSQVPVGPVDTPEVVAARAAHFAEVAAIKSRSKRSVLAYASPLAYTAPLAYSAPIAYSSPVIAPVQRAATLTTVVNTPGHAVSYRVD